MAKGSIYYTSPRTAPGDVTDPAVPLSYFLKYKYMSPGQVLSLFLIEELGLTFTAAAEMFNKYEGAVRLSYLKAYEKREQHREQEAHKKRKQKAPAEIK